MIQESSRVVVCDNTGAKQAMCIRIIGRGRAKAAQIGDTISVTIKSAAPRGTVKKKEVCRAVVVRQTKPFQRPDGASIRFDENAIVLINADKTPRGTRIFGPIARELRDLGFMKIISLAKEVV